MPEGAVATIGHNRPPPAEVAAEHKPRVDKLVAAANAWARTSPPMTTEEEGAKCADFLKQIGDELRAVDDARKVEKRPHDDAAQAVQDAFNPLLALLKACEAVMRPFKRKRLDVIEAAQKAEAARKAEEARKAQEAADIAAAALAAGLAKPVEGSIAAEQAQIKADERAAAAAIAAAAKPQVSGEISGRASGFVTYWEAEITDRVAALTHYQNHAAIIEALQKVANQDARAMKKHMAVPGCRAVEKRRV